MPDSFSNYCRIVFKRCWQDARTWARDNIVWALIVLIASPFVARMRHRGYKIDWELLSASLWIYGFVLLFYILIHLFRTPWKLHKEQIKALEEDEKKIQTIRKTAADTGTELRAQIEQLQNKRPALTIDIAEVIIEPYVGCAECFVRVGIHNFTPDSPTNISQCKLTLEIKGKQYDKSSIRPVAGFATARWDVDDDDPNSYPWREYKAKDEELNARDDLWPDLKDSPLELGVRRDGWIHFHVSGLPAWPSVEEPTGHIYEGVTEDGEYYQQEETNTVYRSNVDGVELRLRDAYGTWHAGRKEKPLSAQGRTMIDLSKK